MKKWVAAALAALIILAGGCGAADRSGKELVIGLMPDVDSIPFLIAQEKGFFKEEGVTVTLKRFKSAMDRDSALQSGNLDGAVSDMLAAAFLRSGGFDAVIASSLEGEYRLVAGKDSGVTTAADLRGKSIAVSRHTVIDYVTSRTLAAAGLKDGEATEVVIPQIPARLEMLRGGKVAAATLPEPMASLAVRYGGRMIDAPARQGVNPSVMVFTKRAAAEKEAEIRALYRAYNKAAAYLTREPAASYMDMVIEKSGFPAAVKDVLALPPYRPAEPPSRRDWDDCMQWLKERKLIPQAYSYDDLTTDRFIRYKK